MTANPDNDEPTLTVVFYRTEADHEPVREWLKELRREDRKTIGEDIKTAQYGWPIGMPLTDPQVGARSVGGALQSEAGHRARHLHRDEQLDGVAPRVYQEILEDAAGGPGNRPPPVD